MNGTPARGFVLESRSYAEADKIIQIYTPSLGRIKAIVKGVRKPKSRLAAAVDLFTESSFLLHKKASADLYLLSQAKVLEVHADLKKDLATLSLLQVLSDLLVQTLQDADPHPELYLLLREFLSALASHKERGEAILTAFLLKLLEALGHPMELERCAECGSSLAGGEAHLVPHRGGALCGDCCPSSSFRQKVSPEGLAILRKLKSLPLGKVHVLGMRAGTSRALFLAAADYLERTVEKKMRALDYYLQVNGMAGAGDRA